MEKSITQPALTDKSGKDSTQPETGVQSDATTTLEPLYFPPEYNSPKSLDEVLAPYSAAVALHSLLTIGSERFTEAFYRAQRSLYRLKLGMTYFTDEQLAQETIALRCAETDVDEYKWMELSFWGLPQSEWDIHDRDLERLLEEMQEEDERYGHLTLEDLMAARVKKIGGEV